MGFRYGAITKIWDVKPVSNTRTDLRVSISRKNQETGEYEDEFSGFVSCWGTAVAVKAAKLNKGDRVRLGDTDVTNRFDKKNGTTYTNFKVFSLYTEGEELPERTAAPAGNVSASAANTAAPSRTYEPQPREYDNEVDDNSLPF